MDYELLFPGRFLKSVEFKGKKVTLTISKIETELLPDKKQKEKIKGIILFKESKKGIVLNKTNAICLAKLFGRNTDGWVGHKVTFYPAPYNEDTCIRVWGSPELKEPLKFELVLPGKSPRVVTLYPTGKDAPKVEAPPSEPETGPTREEMNGDDLPSVDGAEAA
jgi:hypothetical protein